MQSMAALRKHWPLPAALAVLYAALGVALAVSLAQNDGHFVYALDDPYIHMAVAKNLAEHGVYGVTPQGFSYSTSSIVWPWLLWLTHLICGANTIGPMAWNVVFAAAAVSVIYALLKKQGVPPRLNFAFLLIIAFGTPLPAIVFTGLEHTLHVLLAVAFLFVAAKFLAQGSVGSKTSPHGDETSGTRFHRARHVGNVPHGQSILRTLYLVLPVLLTMTRYESALMIAVVCLLWAIRGRIWHAMVLGSLGALPIVVSGLISLAHGWHFLPNSVLLKGRMPPGSSFDQVYESLYKTAATLYHQPHLPAMMAAAMLLLVVLHRRDRPRWTVAQNMLWILLLTTALHVQFAKTGWFFRYEAYLMACGLFVVLMVVYQQLAGAGRPLFSWRPCLLGTAVLLVVATSMIRGMRSTALIPRASSNIYEQHFQMARFVGRYYAGRPWRGGQRRGGDQLLRGSPQPRSLGLVQPRSGRRPARTSIRSWRHCQAGGREPDRAGDGLRPLVRAVLRRTAAGVAEGRRVGNRRQPGMRRQPGFYAVRADQRHRLAEHLAEFSADLPDDVIQRGPFFPEEQPAARVARRP